MSSVNDYFRRRASTASRGSSCVDRISKDRNYRHSSRHGLARSDDRITNLCDRLQSVRRSSLGRPVESSHPAVSPGVNASQDPQSPESPESEVILNLQVMENEMGLRPAGFPRRLSQSSSDRATAQETLNNELEDPLEETNNSPLTVDDKGQLRYFGYSSHMRMVSVLQQSSPPSAKRASYSPSDKSVNPMEAERIADSPETQMRLIDLFFKYQNAAIPILDEEVFRLGYIAGERSDYFSRFLLYSLFLRALNFDDDPLHRETLATIYTRRAKAELLFEMENPTIATIPGLCLFGYYLAGLGSDRACWLYPGIAYRLVFDFGLHEDCRNLVAAGLLTEVDRRGRPTAIRLDDLNVSRLSAQTLGRSGQLVAAWVELASLLDDVLSVINGAPGRVYQESSVKKLSEASQKLLSWFLNLAPELQWDANHPISPGICALHIQFLSITILLNRPFATYLFNRGSKSPPRRRCLEGQTTKVSQQICTANAIRISKLLLAYRQLHEPSEDKEEEKKWLAAIMETLDEIIPWYPVAGRSRNTLAAIMNTCGLSDILKQLASKSGDDQAEMLPNRDHTEISGPSWTTDMDLSFNLGFPFDSAYDVHNISLTGFYAQPSQMIDFGSWGEEDPLYGLNL
ncbi:hypothetical protein N7457_005746 [Penicillium paradoxum]|uniref:uncharacterized protein n=1 Tax=Penicillium paradoxum TaxID=176176 RepID=UPI002546EDC7|nr:uncharacterized protein N7457_005746 [Penicillium paradoxum]KAJ5780586.1 hypothetical protein N7457_005746 [Penicillium paradoxum]